MTSANVKAYIEEVLDAMIGKGARFQARGLREGFSKVFNVSDLQSFSADELVMLFGNADEDWSLEGWPSCFSYAVLELIHIYQL